MHIKKLISALVVIVVLLMLTNCRTLKNSGSGLNNTSELNVVSFGDEAVSEDDGISVASKEPSVKSGTEVQKNNSSVHSSSSNNTAVNSDKTEQSVGASENQSPAVKTTQLYEVSVKNCFALPEFLEKSFYDVTSGKNLPYRLYIPENYSASKKYPVFFWLHGAGERGSDNYTQIQYLSKAFKAAGDLLSGAIIIAPQCPSYGWWNIDEEGYETGWLGAAMHLLDKIRSEYSCDSDRIYVSGLSMGGYATWQVLERYGDLFAAGTPICGWGNTYAGAQLAKIPIWIYHGDSDQTVSYNASVEMYNAIKNAGGNMVHFTTLYGIDHNAWDYALADRKLFCWMFAQSKPKGKNGDDSYEYITALKIVSPQNDIIFTEKDVERYSSSFTNDRSYVKAYLNAEAFARLEKSYKNNLNKEFTVYYYSDKFYKFKPMAIPENNEFLFSDSLDYELISSIICQLTEQN